MKGEVRILLLEDSPADAELILTELIRAGIVCNLRRMETEEEFGLALTEFSPDVILADFRLPRFDGLKALRLAQSSRPDVPFIFVSGAMGEEAAIEALTQGASDYVLKGNLKRLPSAVRRVLREANDRIARHRAEQARMKAEERYHSLVELLPDAILVVQDGRIVLINEAGLKLYGARSHQEIIGRPLIDFVHAESRGEVTLRMHRLLEVGEKPPRLEQKHVRLDGSVVHVEIASARIVYADRDAALVVARDVTERKRDQDQQAQLLARLGESLARLDRASRIRTVLNGINGAILRIRDQQALLEEVCRIAVEEGRLRLAWLGMIDESGAYLEFRAHAGAGRECFSGLRIALSEAEGADAGPARRAVLDGRAVVWDDVQDDPSRGPWQERARYLGYRSVIALPLRVEGRIAGALMLYAEESGFFSEEEKRLLEELAADAGLALAYVRKVEEVERLAYYDPVTGLPRPALVEDRLRQSLARARYTNRVVATLVVNIVQLRAINIRFGRGVGDVVIRAVGEAIAGSLRSGDTVGRLGTYDFIVVLVDIAAASDLPAVLRKTASAIPRSVRLGSEDLPVEVQIGAAVFPRDGQTAELLIRNATIAAQSAFAAKGENVVLYCDIAPG